MRIRNRKQKTENEKTNKEIMMITWIFVIIFVALICYIVYFTAFKSESFINNAYNAKRGELLAQMIQRGSIMAADGSVLARNVINEDGSEKREYPYGNIFAHSVGFFSQGNIGVESIVNFRLLTSDVFAGEKIRNDLNGVKNKGDSVVTTFDIGTQKAAFDALGDRKGAVVVLNVKTGEILAMVSKPDFDPNRIEEIWEELDLDTENSPLLNRATQGLYPPGSTFKIVTALEFIKENTDVSGYEFDCTGSFEFDDVVINCYHGNNHGHMDFAESFAKSCNSSFANISSKLDKQSFRNTCDGLLFNGPIPCPFSYKQSVVDVNASSDSADLIQTGIGQGKTQITPIHMAMITSAIANRGILMKPRVISTVLNSNGVRLKEYKNSEYGRLMSEEEAYQLKYLMREVVVNGTGSGLIDTDGYKAAGKTGSAEYSKDKTKSHAWFTGFAPYDDPEIAVTVIVEGGGLGGETAVPIARAVFDEYLSD